MQVYKTCRCKNCGRFGVTTSRIGYKCTYCQKSHKFVQKRMALLGVEIVFKTADGIHAGQIAREYNRKFFTGGLK